jgi:hypothetical protein
MVPGPGVNGDDAENACATTDANSLDTSSTVLKKAVKSERVEEGMPDDGHENNSNNIAAGFCCLKVCNGCHV